MTDYRFLKVWNKLLLLTFFVVLSGCVYTSPGTNFSDDQTILDNIRQQEAEIVPDYDENNILWGGSVYANKFDLKSDQAQSYIEKIAENLLNSWPQKKPDYTIRLIYGNNLNAHATLNNVIFLSSNWVNGAESEDEIAGVIAHELSHILLGHPVDYAGRNQLSSTLKYMNNAMYMGMLAKDYHLVNNGGVLAVEYLGSEKDQQQIALAVYLGGAIYEMKQSLVDPMFTRYQEEEADKLAVDLLREGGYAPLAFKNNVMNRLAAYRENIRKRIAQEEEAFKELQKAMAKDLENDVARGDISAATNRVVNMLSQTILKTWTDFLESSEQEHFKPEVRKEVLGEYIKKHYRRDRKVSFNTKSIKRMKQKSQLSQIHDGHTKAEDALETLARSSKGEASNLALQALSTKAGRSPYPWYVLGQIRARQARWGDVNSNLSKSISIGGCSPEAYVFLANLYTGEKKTAKAYKLLQQGQKAFNDDPGPFYLGFAQMYREQEKQTELFKTLEECSDYPDKAIAGGCEIMLEQEEQRIAKTSSGNPFDIIIDGTQKITKQLFQ